MWSGIWNHQQQSTDPCCKEPGTLHFPENEPNDPDDHWQDKDEIEEDMYVGIDNGHRTEEFEVDPRGDFFGDYKDYSLEEFALGASEEDHNSDSDDDLEEIDVNSLEPI